MKWSANVSPGCASDHGDYQTSILGETSPLGDRQSRGFQQLSTPEIGSVRKGKGNESGRIRLRVWRDGHRYELVFSCFEGQFNEADVTAIHDTRTRKIRQTGHLHGISVFKAVTNEYIQESLKSNVG